MRYCVECGKSFAPSHPKQKFCTRQCCDRFKARRYRLERQQKGLCPQCGKEMSYRPVRIGSGKSTGKTKITYCEDCRKKFRELHRRRWNSQAAEN